MTDTVREALIAVVDHIERGLVVNNHGGRDFDFVSQLEAQRRAALAEPPNLNDKAVQKRLAAQWGYVKQGQDRLTVLRAVAKCACKGPARARHGAEVTR